MPHHPPPPPTSDDIQIQSIVALLGGNAVIRRSLSAPIDAHELLLQGLPTQALEHLVGSFVHLHKATSLDRAVGVSLRTMQRHKDKPRQRLSQEQSGRTWKFAEILARATALFGSQADAEQWLDRPAMGLDQRRPLDLLATPAGVALIEDFLGRLEFGVYM